MILTILLITATLLGLVEPAKRSPAFVGFDLQSRKPSHGSVTTGLDKRSPFSVSTTDDLGDSGLYLVNVSLGTPPQAMLLAISLEDGDTLVNTPTSSFCKVPDNPEGNCSAYGTYNYNLSSTYKVVNTPFLDAQPASDVFTMGDFQVSSYQFGITPGTYFPFGTLGLGSPGLEAAVWKYDDLQYPTLGEEMVAQKLINSNTFSLWLNDFWSSDGALIFGGFDTDKYTGPLRITSFLQLPLDSGLIQMAMNVSDITIENINIPAVDNFNVTFDTTSWYATLPEYVAQPLYNMVGANYDNNTGFASIDCNQANSPIQVQLNLSTLIWNVTMNELVFPAELVFPPKLLNLSGLSGQCTFAIVPTLGRPNLGLSVLRSAYLVFDLDNKQLAIAQAKFNVTSSNIVEIASGVNGIPGAVRPNSNSSSPTTKPAAATGLGSGAIIGIAVGVALGMILVGSIVGFLLWLRRMKKRAPLADKLHAVDYNLDVAVEKGEDDLHPSSTIMELPSNTIEELPSNAIRELHSHNIEELPHDRSPTELPGA